MPTEFRPDYIRVADDLREQIRSETLTAGAKLPTKRQLAEHYGVGLQAIDAAMIVLKTEGLVRGHQGRGVFVVERSAEGSLDRNDTSPGD